MLQGIIDKFYLTDHPDGKPPERFVKGILLLYLGLLLQTLNNFLDGFNFSAVLFVFVFVGYLIFATGEGKRWARMLLSVLILLNVLNLLFNMAYAYGLIGSKIPHQKVVELPVYLAVLFCAEAIIELWGWALMHTPLANGWFNRKRAH